MCPFNNARFVRITAERDYRPDWREAEDRPDVPSDLPGTESPSLVQLMRMTPAEWDPRTHTRDLHGVEVEIRAPEEVDVQPPDIRILLFQVTRELLFNVAKHAEANRAVVEVGREDGRVRVSVTDEGKDFDPASLAPAHHRRGLGLFSARERLRMRGGDLEIQSVPGDGTRIVAYAPLAPGPE